MDSFETASVELFSSDILKFNILLINIFEHLEGDVLMDRYSCFSRRSWKRLFIRVNFKLCNYEYINMIDVKTHLQAVILFMEPLL